jgi:hypothetical protein
MDLTFISLLRVLSKRVVVSGPNSHGACSDYASQLSTAIERGCSIGANHAQNRHLTSSDLTPGVAIARFRIILARFNKRSTQLFSCGRSSFATPPVRVSKISSNAATGLVEWVSIGPNTLDQHRCERRHGISDHHGNDFRDILPRMLFERMLPAPA